MTGTAKKLKRAAVVAVLLVAIAGAGGVAATPSHGFVPEASWGE
jgi:hypothetical protein